MARREGGHPFVGDGMRGIGPIACVSILVSVLASAGVVSAQDAVTLIVEGETSEEERDAIAGALRDELGLEVRAGAEAAGGELALRVSIRARRARLEVTRPARQRIVRAVALPRDRAGRVHTLVTLAVNLARDEAAELLASLRRPARSELRPTAQVAAPQEPEAAPRDAEPSAHAPAPAEAAPGDADSSAHAPAEAPATQAAPAAEPAAEQPVEAAADVEAAAEAADTDAPAEDPWRHRWVRLGAGAHLGTVPEIGGGVAPWTIFGLELVIAPIPELAAGVRDLGVISDGRAVIIVAPVVEGALRVHERLALHAIVGCDLQAAIGGEGNASFSAAPRLGLGARFYADPIFSIALDVTGRVVATSAFHTMVTTLPSGAVLLSVGLSFAFHV